MQPVSRLHYFNPLPRKEGDRFMESVGKIGGYFNPLPRKEGDTAGTSYTPTVFYFNPLPRKEGDVAEDAKTTKTQVISIHSLVKRETANIAKIQLKS